MSFQAECDIDHKFRESRLSERRREAAAVVEARRLAAEEADRQQFARLQELHRKSSVALFTSSMVHLTGAMQRAVIETRIQTVAKSFEKLKKYTNGSEESDDIIRALSDLRARGKELQEHLQALRQKEVSHRQYVVQLREEMQKAAVDGRRARQGSLKEQDQYDRAMRKLQDMKQRCEATWRLLAAVQNGVQGLSARVQALDPHDILRAASNGEDDSTEDPSRDALLSIPILAQAPMEDSSLSMLATVLPEVLYKLSDKLVRMLHAAEDEARYGNTHAGTQKRTFSTSQRKQLVTGPSQRELSTQRKASARSALGQASQSRTSLEELLQQAKGPGLGGSFSKPGKESAGSSGPGSPFSGDGALSPLDEYESRSESDSSDEGSTGRAQTPVLTRRDLKRVAHSSASFKTPSFKATPPHSLGSSSSSLRLQLDAARDAVVPAG
eukprot:jgi/Chlat1/7061/Chrsp56S06713